MTDAVPALGENGDEACEPPLAVGAPVAPELDEHDVGASSWWDLDGPGAPRPRSAGGVDRD